MNGPRLASASDDGTVKVWDAQPRAEARTPDAKTRGLDGLSRKAYLRAMPADVTQLLNTIETGPDELLRVHDALAKLAEEDALKAELIKLRFFVGLGIPEAAEILGISATTAKRHWTFARAWLYDELKS